MSCPGFLFVELWQVHIPSKFAAQKLPFCFFVASLKTISHTSALEAQKEVLFIESLLSIKNKPVVVPVFYM